MRGEQPLVHDDAEWLLDFYKSFSMHANASDTTEAALRALSIVSGPFAFVVYDSTSHRVWAARDAAGAPTAVLLCLACCLDLLALSSGVA